jgi:hypothetical protein
VVKEVVLICVAAITVPSEAGEPLTMRLTPATVAREPAVLRIRTTIEADADNRALEIIVESEDFYRSASVQLDGATAPRLNVVEFKSLPNGLYEVTSVLIGSRGERATVSRSFRVSPAGSPAVRHGNADP